MNAKLCKSLRRVARDLSGSPATERRWRNGPQGIGTDVLAPDCGRAAYRRLKKEFRK